MAGEQTHPSSTNDETPDSGEPVENGKHPGLDDFSPKGDLPGKVDSGPEPDVFGREIPPQT
jgi:hypothetical protein